MAKKSLRRCSERERAARRCADRERLRRAAQELLCSEGWARWVRVRASFRVYSAGNCMLLAHQFHERRIDPQHVAGFRTWLTLGRCVRKGERALRVFAPVTVKERDAQGRETGERKVFFKTAFVFETSQTEPLPGVEPTPLQAPSEPLTGDSHAHLLAPLERFAQSLGYTVSFQEIAGSAGGWCETKAKRIVVDARAPANAQVRTLIHELAHTFGIDYKTYSRAQAEVIVDTVTFVACTSVGLAVDGESIPYVAGWGEDGALAAVSEFAETIDEIARRIEDAALTPEGGRAQEV
ncbi:MAG: ArdC-like ssDNA-binding domain-containing protein [Solirubrobacteraceae bacterium]